MNRPTPEELIQHYKMQKHPEGGYYAQSYRAQGILPQSALPKGIAGDRIWSSAIYFLLANNEKSKLHKLVFDESWHFYLGDPLVVVELTPNGTKETVIGPDIRNGHKLQHFVKGGTWFGSYLPKGSEYALVGCTVAPGFEFADFEMGARKKLLELYPNAKNTIESLT